MKFFEIVDKMIISSSNSNYFIYLEIQISYIIYCFAPYFVNFVALKEISIVSLITKENHQPGISGRGGHAVKITDAI